MLEVVSEMTESVCRIGGEARIFWLRRRTRSRPHSPHVIGMRKTQAANMVLDEPE